MSEKFQLDSTLRPGEAKSRIADVEKAQYMAEAGDKLRTMAVAKRIAGNVIKDAYIRGLELSRDDVKYNDLIERDAAQSKLKLALDSGSITNDEYEARKNHTESWDYQRLHPESFSARAVFDDYTDHDTDYDGGRRSDASTDEGKKKLIEKLPRESNELDAEADKAEQVVAGRYDEVKDL